MLHLGAADLIAHLTLTDRPSFQTAMGKLSSGDASLNQLAGQEVPALSGRELWQWFLVGRQAMIDALRELGPKDRIAWIGPRDRCEIHGHWSTDGDLDPFPRSR